MHNYSLTKIKTESAKGFRRLDEIVEIKLNIDNGRWPLSNIEGSKNRLALGFPANLVYEY